MRQELWKSSHKHWTEPQIVDANYVIYIYVAVSKFGDALGVGLDETFDGVKPILTVKR